MARPRGCVHAGIMGLLAGMSKAGVVASLQAWQPRRSRVLPDSATTPTLPAELTQGAHP